MNMQTSANIITSGVHSLRTEDAFPIVASERSDDRKCVCCSQAMGYIDLIQIEKKKSSIVSRLSFTEFMACILKHYVDYLNYY